LEPKTGNWEPKGEGTSDSIHAPEDVPEEKKDFIEKNAAYFKQ